ncbi:hypothetical protein HZR81_13520 [Pseudomonas sp. LM13]
MQEESGPNGWMMFPLIPEGNPHSIIQANMNRRSVALVSCAAFIGCRHLLVVFPA